MADTKISALSNASALGGTEQLAGVQSGGNVNITPAQLGTYIEARASLAELIRDTMGTAIVQGSNMTITVNDAGDTITFASTGGTGQNIHPGYVSGNTYRPNPFAATANGTAIGTSGTIRFYPCMIYEALTISVLGTKVSTASASGNFQLAYYAANASTKLPTGNALMNTASLSTTSATAVSGAVTPTALAAGLYWMAGMTDNATAAFLAYNANNDVEAALVGSPTFSDAANSGTVLSLAGTYGTWPDMTSASPTKINSSTGGVVVLFTKQ